MLGLTPRQLTVAAMTMLLNMVAVLNFRSLGAVMAEIVQDIGASPDQELWLPDSYLTALIVATPIAASLAMRFGAHRLLVTCVCGLTASSALMSAANDMESLSALLFLQGLFAGPIMPTTQSVMVSHFHGETRAFGMAIWNTGSVVGVLTGSLLGGYLSEHYSWRLTFLVGIPFGLVALALVLKTLRHDAGSTDVKLDFGQIILLGGGLTALGAAVNLMDNAGIDRTMLIGLSAFAVASLVLFALRNHRSAAPLLNLRVLTDRPLAVAVLIGLGSAALNVGLLETEALTEIMKFDPETLGLNGAIRAIAFLVGVALGARLPRLMSERMAVALALVLLGVGKFGTTLYTADTSFVAAMWPPVLSQMGLGILGTLLAVVAFQTVAKPLVIPAAGVFVFSRVFGNAIGLAGANTVRVWNEGRLITAGAGEAAAVVGSYVEVFWVGTALTAALLPFIFLLASRPRLPDATG